MAYAHHSAAKNRLQLSTLLLLLIGLCSIGSPDSFKSAHLHHRSPASSSRTSRHLNRSRANGSSRTSSDAEIEPELAASAKASPPDHLQPLSFFVLPSRTHVVRESCISCIAQDDQALVKRFIDGPNRGRAPPVA